ncbi:LysR family transcriptional regulator [Acidovorax sp. Leaf76]|uniref:LysR family transcriptional regulator n=1 Tax=unclassified Acidovorax TaxID=2684926 RepID=UPI0006F24A40|nr:MULTISPECIES: LysR family transcriptional regulator [unclassified Acidovorax]KQO22156.1 LysR family transcriptional regulator [Acidovorax sp. Leaf76]KQO35226.1 LysR family transcriptional regulator [Acidovorax sp. Leaf84]KQS35008.1 LysR family transcriptional regulator [Acidovorax sp. Leaf191]
MTQASDESRKSDGPVGWELYRSYLGVLREGSLSGAARALGVTQPTVGRHIAALEQALGLTLFTRSQQGLLPTEAALALQPHAEAMGHSAAALVRAASGHGGGDGVRGTVRVTASEVIGVEVLPPILAQLQADHPALCIELALSNKVQDLLHREADIAIRMTEPRQEALIARRVGVVQVGLYAHARYLQAHGMPKSLADLQQHRLIGFDEETPFLRNARKVVPAWRREAFALRSDSDLAQLALVRAGCGIGVCQVGLAGRAPELVRVLGAQFSVGLDTWVVMHEDLRGSPRCQHAFDALAQGLQRYISEAAVFLP